MKYGRYIFYALLLFSSISFSQQLSIGLGGGIDFVQGDNYYTHPLEWFGLYDINGTRANFPGMKLGTEYHFNLASKYKFATIPFAVRLNFLYSPLRGCERISYFDEDWGKVITPEVSTILDVWSIHVGADYNLPIEFINSFVTVSLLANHFDETYTHTNTERYEVFFPVYRNGMRYGFSLGMGAAYDISDKLAVELSGNFSVWNEFGRRDGEELFRTIGLNTAIYYKIM